MIFLVILFPLSHKLRSNNYHPIEVALTQLLIENLSYWNYKPVNLTVGPGDIVCLYGPSGCGKTLFLRALTNLDVSEGKVFLDETESQSIPAPEWRKRLGFLPADTVWWYNTVGEHFQGLEESWLEELGFPSDVLTWEVSRLSVGESKRLGLLRMLCNKPRALLLDEPTANLDQESVQSVETLIRDYQKKEQAPIIWVSHEERQRERIASRFINISKEGQWVEQ
ncbi:MAG: putative ABC transport system ATP-binding protein [Chlamydiales bacterium]